jgi:hypothetical protein
VDRFAVAQEVMVRRGVSSRAAQRRRGRIFFMVKLLSVRRNSIA